MALFGHLREGHLDRIIRRPGAIAASGGFGLNAGASTIPEFADPALKACDHAFLVAAEIDRHDQRSALKAGLWNPPELKSGCVRCHVHRPLNLTNVASAARGGFGSKPVPVGKSLGTGIRLL